MKRKQLLDQLEEYRTRWPEEGETCGRFVDFVESHEDCFERSLELGHVTGSAWLVNKAGSQVLLTHHRKLGQWFQLGGHADGESDVAKVALQEAWEESGIADVKLLSENPFDIDIHLISERRGEAAHYHYDVRFACQARDSEAFAVSQESLDLAWVDISGLHAYTQEESMLRMRRKWVDLQMDLRGGDCS